MPLQISPNQPLKRSPIEPGSIAARRLESWPQWDWDAAGPPAQQTCGDRNHGRNGTTLYPLVKYVSHDYGKSLFSIGKSTINGQFSVAMLVYQRVQGEVPPVINRFIMMFVTPLTSVRPRNLSRALNCYPPRSDAGPNLHLAKQLQRLVPAQAPAAHLSVKESSLSSRNGRYILKLLFEQGTWMNITVL